MVTRDLASFPGTKGGGGGDSVAIKCMRKQCVPGALSPPPPPGNEATRDPVISRSTNLEGSRKTSINSTKLGKSAEKMIQPWPDQPYWFQCPCHNIALHNKDNLNLRVALFSGYPHIYRCTHYY